MAGGIFHIVYRGTAYANNSEEYISIIYEELSMLMSDESYPILNYCSIDEK